jgi:diguanylate cyclase (GGDEF)-like protein
MTEGTSRAPADLHYTIDAVTLRFLPEIEERYETETGPERCRQLIVCGLVALTLYNVFLISDWRLVSDVFMQAVIVRVGVVTPLAVAIVFSLLRSPVPFWREAFQASISLIVAASVLYLTLISESPLHVYHHVGIVLVVLFANVVQRLHFPFAVAASIGTFGLYLAAILALQDLPWPAKSNAVLVLFGACIFTLIGNYQLERQLRRSWLISLRDRLKHDELDTLSRTDPLTGLGNRRKLDQHLLELWADAANASQPVCLLLLDVDHFKPYNDSYGHPAGDLCLKRIAALICGELRSPKDVAYRFGGEEFLVLLPDTCLTEGVRVSERIRQAVERSAIPHGGSPVARVLTISVGVAATVPAGAISPDELIMSADNALYAAKHHGRNQIWPPRQTAGARVARLEDARSSRRGA